MKKRYIQPDVELVKTTAICDDPFGDLPSKNQEGNPHAGAKGSFDDDDAWSADLWSNPGDFGYDPTWGAGK